MPTTCPRCGLRSPATSESCRDCGRDLYRVSYPAPSGAFWLSSRINRVPARITVSVALLLVGAGISTGLLLQGGDADEEPTSQSRLPAQAVPREPTPSVAPTSAKPSKTKPPPKPTPSKTQPAITPSATPSPRQTSRDPLAGIPEAQRALKFADEVTEQWASPGPGSTHWNRGRWSTSSP
jgi:hypothetical protein